MWSKNSFGCEVKIFLRGEEESIHHPVIHHRQLISTYYRWNHLSDLIVMFSASMLACLPVYELRLTLRRFFTNTLTTLAPIRVCSCFSLTFTTPWKELVESNFNVIIACYSDISFAIWRQVQHLSKRISFLDSASCSMKQPKVNVLTPASLICIHGCRYQTLQPHRMNSFNQLTRRSDYVLN